MDFINLSTSMSMLDLVRYLIQDTNYSFSFYNGQLSSKNKWWYDVNTLRSLGHLVFTLVTYRKKEQPYNCKSFISMCQHICQRAREHWIVHNIGIIANDYGELSTCVTSPQPNVPAEVMNFIVETVTMCANNLEKKPLKGDNPDEVETDESMDEDISSDLIQVNATMAEVNRRIDEFIHCKLEQTNLNNVLDFCGRSSASMMCARVDAVLVRKKDSFSHMAVRNVLDRYITKGAPSQLPSKTPSALVEKCAIQQTSVNSNKREVGESSMLPEKRRYDIVSLEAMLDVTKKQKMS